MSQPVSTEKAITQAYNANLSLSLDRDLSTFLMGIYFFCDAQKEPTFSTGDLQTIFHRISALCFQEVSTRERRAGAAINRLREQHLINKMDGVGDNNTYVLSPLGKAVCQHWDKNEIMSRQSLVLYTGHLRILLEEILKHVEQGGDPPHWTQNVIAPLREVIAELISGIDRRQQGMVAAQKNIEQEISKKFSADWFSALDACEEMIRTTGETIKEVQTVLLQETDSVIGLLEQIAERSLDARQTEAFDAAERVRTQMEAIRQWAHYALKEWSTYHNNVNLFIRMNVRTDPHRKITGRMQNAIGKFYDRPWTIKFPDSPPFIHLREEAFDRPLSTVDVTGRVRRARVDEEEREIRDPLLEAIGEEIRRCLEETGRANLMEIFQKYLPEMDRAKAYSVAGTMVGMLAKEGVAIPQATTLWEQVPGTSYQLQNLTIVRQERRG